MTACSNPLEKFFGKSASVGNGGLAITDKILTGDEADQTSVIEHLNLRYYLKNLSPNLKEDAVVLYGSIKNFDEGCTLPNAISSSDLTDLTALLRYECPELMMLGSCSYVSGSSSDNVREIILSYSMTESEYLAMRSGIEDKISSFKQATRGMGEAQTESYVYEEIASACAYSTADENCENAYGALVSGRAKCDGACAGFMWVLNELGIACSTVTGDSSYNSDGHAWSMVQVGGSYHFTDITSDLRSSESAPEPMHPAYNVPESWIAREYTISPLYARVASNPASFDMAQSYHVENGTFIYEGEDPTAKLTREFENAWYYRQGFALQFETVNDMASFTRNIEQYAQPLANRFGRFTFQIYALGGYDTVYLEIER